MKSVIGLLLAMSTTFFVFSSANALVITCKFGMDTIVFKGAPSPGSLAAVGAKVLKINGVEPDLYNYDYSQTSASMFDYDFNTGILEQHESSSNFVTVRTVQGINTLRNYLFDLSQCSNLEKSRILVYDQDFSQQKYKRLNQGLCVCK